MNPDKTLSDLTDLMEENDRQGTIEKLEELSEWIKAGGYFPKNIYRNGNEKYFEIEKK